MGEELEGYMTLRRAAEIAGYVSDNYGNLRHAAAKGRLRTTRLGRMLLTRQEWLDAYLATIGPQAGRPRGQPRTPKPQP